MENNRRSRFAPENESGLLQLLAPRHSAELDEMDEIHGLGEEFQKPTDHLTDSEGHDDTEEDDEEFEKLTTSVLLLDTSDLGKRLVAELEMAHHKVILRRGVARRSRRGLWFSTPDGAHEEIHMDDMPEIVLVSSTLEGFNPESTLKELSRKDRNIRFVSIAPLSDEEREFYGKRPGLVNVIPKSGMVLGDEGAPSFLFYGMEEVMEIRQIIRYVRTWGPQNEAVLHAQSNLKTAEMHLRAVQKSKNKNEIGDAREQINRAKHILEEIEGLFGHAYHHYLDPS